MLREPGAAGEQRVAAEQHAPSSRQDRAGCMSGRMDDLHRRVADGDLSAVGKALERAVLVDVGLLRAEQHGHVEGSEQRVPAGRVVHVRVRHDHALDGPVADRLDDHLEPGRDVDHRRGGALVARADDVRVVPVWPDIGQPLHGTGVGVSLGIWGPPSGSRSSARSLSNGGGAGAASGPSFVRSGVRCRRPPRAAPARSPRRTAREERRTRAAPRRPRGRSAREQRRAHRPGGLAQPP